ncbi:MAG: hypothetical protein C0467_21400 [Planctomycetaceae bacterium]|nr:hypothetical protein [Planctomycetaceae bacterium]
MPNLIRRVLLNAFQSPTGTIRNHKKQSPLSQQLELLEDRVVPATFVVNSISTKLNAGAPTGVQTATLNDYTLLNNVFDLVTNGDTIVLNGTFDWTNAFARASWAKGSDGTSGTVLNDTNDDYSIYVPPNLNNITLTAAPPVAGKYNATIKVAGDSGAVATEWFLYFDQSGTNQDWTISNLSIENFDVAIAMFNTGGPTNAYSGTTITNNRIVVPKDVITGTAGEDVESNVGILIGNGIDQTISNNSIFIAGNGVSANVNNPSLAVFATSIGIEVQTSSGALYDGLQITGNTITVTGVPNATNPEIVIGVSENSFATGSNITISGNSFTRQGAASQAKNFDSAFVISAHSLTGTSTVTYANNTIFGANRGFEWASDGLDTIDFAGLDPVELIGNNISNTFTGVLVRSNGAGYLFQNTIASGGTNSVGVLVQEGGRLERQTTGPAVEQNIITGAKYGIQIDNDAGTIGTINFNGLFGNTTSNVLTNLGSPIEVNNNWWGTLMEPTIAAKITGTVTRTTNLSTATDILVIDEFDFQAVTGNRLQNSSISVLPNTTYTADRSFGWTTTTGLAGFQNSALAALAGNPWSGEFQDGIFRATASANVFRIDFATASPVVLTAVLGNGVRAYSGLKVEFSTDGVTFGSAISGIAVAAKSYTTVTSGALTPGTFVGKFSVFVRFSGGTAALPGWAVAGLKVLPSGSVGPLVVSAPSASPLQANGLSVDTFTVTGATPGGLLTVSTNLGTLLAPDASNVTAGIQVVADSDGNASIQLRRPVVPGTAILTVIDVSSGTVTDTNPLTAPDSEPQVYEQAAENTVIKFDTTSSGVANGASLPDPSWIGVQNNTLYSAATGYGWNRVMTGADNPINLAPGVTDFDDQSMFRDYNYSTSTALSTFTIFVGKGNTASVKLYTYSSNPAHNPLGMTVYASGDNGTQKTLTAGSSSLTVTGTGDEFSGLLTIMITKGSLVTTGNTAWVVNGIEVTLTNVI